VRIVDTDNKDGLAELQRAATETVTLDEATADWAADSRRGPAFEPKILAFVCNWCTYTGADLAGTSRLKMAPNVRVLRLPCSSRVSPLFVMKALERGADGVIVSGCHTGDCHYNTGNYYTRRRLAILHGLLDFMGVDTRRVTFSWVSASEGGKWQQVVNETTERVKQLGPRPRDRRSTTGGCLP
jgi:F420-non-reducing hydrogenase iron-sulfur subunit